MTRGGDGSNQHSKPANLQTLPQVSQQGAAALISILGCVESERSVITEHTEPAELLLRTAILIGNQLYSWL